MNTEGIQLRPNKYPSNWEVKQLEEICLRNGLVRGPFGGSLKKEFFTKDGCKVYEQKNAIYKDSEIGSYYIDEEKFNELKRFEVHENDFIVSCSGTIGKIFLMPKGAEPGVINQALLLIKIDRNIINQQFFYSYFEWENFQKSIIDNTQGGAMQNLVGMEIFRKTYIPIPPIHEQHAIAEALSDVDSLIEAQEALIAKKRAIKQGVMQELLTGKRRLPGFSGKWEEKRLEEIAIIFKGSGLSKSSLITTGKNNCILYGELFTTYDRVIKKVKSRTNQIFGVLSKSGDVLMPGSTTTVGLDLAIASALLVDNVLLGGDINVIRAKNDFSFSPIYLAYYLSNINREKISEITQGITIIHLYGKSLLKLLLRLPSFEEQEEIAQNLFEIDNEIKALEIKRDKTIFIKQAMMQELLTGRIRLTGV